MIRDLLSRRVIQLGIAFLIVVATGSLFYNWQVQRTFEHVSPFGFGPYPEVPAEYTARHGKTVWQYPGSLPQYNQRNIELIHRVMIALWNEGDTRFISATLQDGKIYVNYPNTMYVRYAVHKSPDGTVHRRITSWSAGEENQAAIDQILVGEIPTGVTLIDKDSEDVGIDPYTFLGLE